MKSRRTRAGHAGEAGGRTGKIPDDRQWRKFHQGFCRPIQSGCGRNAAATISGAGHAGGTRHPASSIVAAVHWTDRSFRMTSAPARYPPLAVAGASPALPQPFSRIPERRLGRLAGGSAESGARRDRVGGDAGGSLAIPERRRTPAVPEPAGRGEAETFPVPRSEGQFRGGRSLSGVAGASWRLRTGGDRT